MTSLHLVADDAEAPKREREEPKIFVRVIPTPPGMPWDQARAAALEARVGAPLPLGEVVYQLKRVEPWSRGRPGRHAAFYIRAGEVGDLLEASPRVDGRPIAVRFQSFAEQRRRLRKLAVAVASAVVAGLVVVGLAAAVLGARAKNAERLEAVEQSALHKLKQAEALASLKRQSRVLETRHVRGRSLKDALADLAWAAAAKAPAARIEALHWDQGDLVVEVRGEDPPFTQTDRTVSKSPKPARAGVFLWGVAPPEPDHGRPQ
jgi:hypothetical protein